MGIENYLKDKMKRAEHEISKKKNAEYDNKEWKITKCIYCGSNVNYIPRRNFKGKLNCPKCGKRFEIPSLDKWLQE